MTLTPQQEAEFEARFRREQEAEFEARFQREQAAQRAPAPQAPAALPSPMEVIERGGRNLPRSAEKFFGGIAEAIMSPAQTGLAITDVLAGGLQNILPNKLVNWVNSFSSDPSNAQRAVEMANAAGGMYKQRYGSVPQVLETLQEDPVGFFADFSALLGGAGALSRSSKLTTLSRQIDPLLVAAKPVTAAAGALGRNVLAPIVSPRTTAVNALAEAGGPGLAAALEATKQMPTTPGVKPTLAERALEGGVTSPTLATMERRLPGVPGVNTMVVQRGQETAQAIQNQLARIDEQLAQTRTAAMPQGAPELRAVRDSLAQQLTRERGGLEAATQQVAAALPEVSQREVGTAITQRAKQLETGVRSQTIQPKFAEAFETAGSAKVDVSKPIARAEEILGTKLTDFAPETAPATVRAMQKLKLAPETTIIRQPGMPPIPKTVTPTPEVTLQQIQDIRAGINADIASANTLTAPTDATTLRNLYQLHDELTKAVQESKTLSAEAKAKYLDAVETYKTEFVPRFRTGLPQKLLQKSGLSENRILPDNVVKEFLAQERGAEQFLTMVRTDPTSRQAFAAGIKDIFREAIIDPATGQVKPKAAAQFIAKHKDQLNVLSQGGMNLADDLRKIELDTKQIAKGYAGLEEAAKNLQFDRPHDMISAWLKSPRKMAQGMQRLDAQAKLAVKADVTHRALEAMAVNPADALKYLDTHKDALHVALKKNALDELRDAAKWHVEVAEVAKQAPKPITPQIVNLTKDFTPEQLTDLTVVANDIKRMKTITDLAAQGAPAPSPVVGRLGTEALAEAGAATSQIPSVLNSAYLFARRVWSGLEGRVNRKSAAILADYMYRDPDAAIAALKQQAARGKTTRARPVTITGAARATQPESVNALAPEDEE